MNISTQTYTIPDLTLPPGDLWVFGYGSVMWRPGFEHAERRAGRVYGYHRSLCVWSWVHRGTRARPGLVLGLDVGGSCQGIAYRVPAADKDAVADYLYRRELVTDGYQAMLHRVYFGDGSVAEGPVTALSFRANRGHPQYAGRLDHRHAADTVRGAHGVSGANPDYVASAVQQLHDMGIADGHLRKINLILQEN